MGSLWPGWMRARVDGSDLIQAAMVHVVRKFPAFRGTTLGQLRAWLRRIALRTANGLRRAHLRPVRQAPAREGPIDSQTQVPANSSDSPVSRACSLSWASSAC